jgi:hypothetical protein
MQDHNVQIYAMQVSTSEFNTSDSPTETQPYVTFTLKSNATVQNYNHMARHVAQAKSEKPIIHF